MFTIDELLSKRNQNDAMINLQKKKDGQGYDGVRITEFPEYWKLNHTTIENAIRQKKYEPGIIMSFEILSGKGKKREVSIISRSNDVNRSTC